MAHKPASSIRKFDRILKNRLLTGHFNMFAQNLQDQPRSIEASRFLSQSSVYLSSKQEGLDKFFSAKESNKGATNAEENGAPDEEKPSARKILAEDILDNMFEAGVDHLVDAVKKGKNNKDTSNVRANEASDKNTDMKDDNGYSTPPSKSAAGAEAANEGLSCIDWFGSFFG